MSACADSSGLLRPGQSRRVAWRFQAQRLWRVARLSDERLLGCDPQGRVLLRYRASADDQWKTEALDPLALIRRWLTHLKRLIFRVIVLGFCRRKDLAKMLRHPALSRLGPPTHADSQNRRSTAHSARMQGPTPSAAFALCNYFRTLAQLRNLGKLSAIRDRPLTFLPGVRNNSACTADAPRSPTPGARPRGPRSSSRRRDQSAGRRGSRAVLGYLSASMPAPKLM